MTEITASSEKVTKQDRRQSAAFGVNYVDGKFYLFKHWLTDDSEQCEFSYEWWIEDLDLTKTQSALLIRMLLDLDLSITFFWKRDEGDESDEQEASLCLYSREDGVIANADLYAMVHDAFDDSDISSIEVIREFRDMVVERTAEYERRVQQEHPEEYAKAERGVVE
jgi:hypothetical protein